jgi:hypothetical protein
MNSNLSAAKRWLEQLSEDIEEQKIPQGRRDEILSQLKFLGRDIKVSQTLYDEAGLKVLCHYAFSEYPRTTAREAMRCLANALLLLPHTQDMFYKLGYVPKVAEGLKEQNNGDEFLHARILFLMTYNKQVDLATLVEAHDVPGSIIAHIERHDEGTRVMTLPDAEAIGAVIETLKLLFNITNALPQYTERFSPTVSHLLAVIPRIPIPMPPLSPGAALIYVINALSNLDFRNKAAEKAIAGIPNYVSLAVDRLLSVLDEGLKAYSGAQLDIQAVPLLIVLRKINDVADEAVRTKLKTKLLPEDTERNVPLGQTSTLASRLLKLTTSPGLEHLPEVISSLLFELSDKDASAFVKNIGYGYAAGYLMSHKIPIPENAKSNGGAGGNTPINPVTGQRLDREEPVDLPPMTDEEKEREAERLFVLFERLKATGVVDVENPVKAAMEQGGVEEIDESPEGSTGR